MIPVRLSEFWEKTKTHLNTPTIQSMLSGGKVYLEGEDYSRPEGAEGGQWGRIIIAPTSSAYPSAPSAGNLLHVGVLIRAEVSNYTNPSYKPQVHLEALQTACNKQLAGWLQDPTTYVRQVLPFTLWREWQPLPLWDDARGLYFLSSTYRTQVTHVGIAPVGVIGAEGGSFVGA